MKLVRRRTGCRACGKRKLRVILDLGKTPPANAFLKSNSQKLISKERWFSLKVNLCQDCGMIQLAHVVDPKLLFGDYVYVSSTSPVFMRHFEDLTRDVTKRLKLKPKSLVVDIGSNDGILLKPFLRKGFRVLGIEPAGKIAKLANKQGITTITKFFSADLARNLVKKYGQADLVTATNVFAHIDNLDEVMRGVKLLLKPDGVFLVEVAYLRDLVKKNLFDLVYHEHVCYWAVGSMKVLAERLGMKIFRVERVPTHGGSIRVLMKLKTGKWQIEANVASLIYQEKILGLTKIAIYKGLARRIKQNKQKLKKLLLKLKHQGKVIVGFGAPAKGNTLLNYFKINKTILDYIVDDSPYKQGLYTPGTHIPLLAPEKIYQNKPDYVLILAWNFAESIMKTHWRYYKNGGKFILPVPLPRIIT